MALIQINLPEHKKKPKRKRRKEFSKTIDRVNLLSAVLVTVVLIVLTVFSGFLSMSDIDLNPLGQVALSIWGEYAVTHSFYIKKSEKENCNKYPSGTDGIQEEVESQK